MAKSLRDALKPSAKKEQEKQEDVHYADEGDGDTSPTIQAFSVSVSHVGGGMLQTIITANIHGGTGLISKRTVVPGQLTAAKLAAMLDNVAAW